MEKALFEQQIERLKREWRNSYGEERVKVFWRAFENEDGLLFGEAVDLCLLKHRSAPLIEEISEALEEAKLQRKSQEASLFRYRQADDHRCSFSQDEIRKIVQMIEDRMNKKVSKEEFDTFCDLLDEAAKKTSPKNDCNICGDSGLIWSSKSGYSYVYRCFCGHGSKHDNEIPIFQKPKYEVEII